MTRLYSKKQRPGGKRSSKRTTTTLKNAPCSDVKASSLRQRRGRYRVRLTKSADKKPGRQCLVLKHRGKALTLRQWAMHGQAGLTPTQIWRFIRIGFPLGEALGGREAVARAIAFVGTKQARSVRRKERLLRKRRRIVSNRIKRD